MRVQSISALNLGLVYKFPENLLFPDPLCFRAWVHEVYNLAQRIKTCTVFVDLTEIKEGYLWGYFCNN